jgi:hypothetical protein
MGGHARTIRLIKHEAVPKCGTFEIRFSDGSPSRYFYIPFRRLNPDQVDSRKALERAKALAGQSGTNSIRNSSTGVIRQIPGGNRRNSWACSLFASILFLWSCAQS